MGDRCYMHMTVREADVKKLDERFEPGLISWG